MAVVKMTQGHKVGCFRELQNSIEDSVHSLLARIIREKGYPGFEITKNAIRHVSGGEAKFRGLSRNPTAVASMEGFRYFWVEEGQAVSAESLKILKPTLREDDSQVWISMNRGSSADPVAQRFLSRWEDTVRRDGLYEDSLHLIVQCNYNDNPWFPQVLEDERVWDYENLPRAEYDHIWGGEYNDSVANSLIPAGWFDAAIDSHIKLGFDPKGSIVCAHDPSDNGPDAKAVAIRHGSVITLCEEMTTGDANDGMDWATGIAIANNADAFVWDADGLGASLRRQALQAIEGKKMTHLEYKGSEAVDAPETEYQPFNTDARAKTNRQTFKNKRAQYHWYARDRFYNTYRAVAKGEYVDPDTLISLSSSIPNLEKLRSEMCRIPIKPNSQGLIQIMPKPEMQRAGISSPNMADSIIMTLSPPPPAIAVTLDFASPYA